MCVSCPEEEEEEEDEDGGRRRPPCYECPEDCCPLGLGFAHGMYFAFFVLLVIPVGIIVTIFLVSLPEQVYNRPISVPSSAVYHVSQEEEDER